MEKQKSSSIIFFIENDRPGGVDSFILSLVKYWPNKNDRIILVHNYNHPGAKIYQRISHYCKIDSLYIPLSFVFSKAIFGFFPQRLQQFFRPIFKLFFFPIQFLIIQKYFKKADADILMVINGGYPGGETCRVANIVWNSLYKYSRPNFHNFHNFAVSPFYGTRWYENFVDKIFLNSISGMIGVSKVCAQSLTQRDGLKQYLPSYIYNGIDQNNTALKELPSEITDLGLSKSQMCIMLANYEDRKGHEFVIKSFKKVLNKLPNVHLIFCGAGSEEEIIKVTKLTEKYNVAQNIHILNFIENGSLLIPFFDLLLVGSQEFESFGLVVAEAMLSKVPVISTSTGGLREVLKDNCGGYLIDRNDEEAYSKCIIKLLESESLRIKVGEQGFNRVKSKFNAKLMAQKYHNRLVGNLEWIEKVNKVLKNND